MPDDDKSTKTDQTQQYLAKERTFLSWVRTSIALVGVGFIISKFSFFLTEYRLAVASNTIGIHSLPASHPHFSIDEISNWIGMSVTFLAGSLIYWH